MSIIGNNIKRIRKLRGWTQKQLADNCNTRMTKSQISNYENGYSHPLYAQLDRIRIALKCSFDDLQILKKVK